MADFNFQTKKVQYVPEKSCSGRKQECFQRLIWLGKDTGWKTATEQSCESLYIKRM